MSGFTDELDKHRIPDEWVKHPEPMFTFAPSEGDPFTMTAREVADVMAFVRDLKAKADRESSQHTCPKCGGDWDGVGCDYRPIERKCKSCNEFWTP